MTVRRAFKDAQDDVDEAGATVLVGQVLFKAAAWSLRGTTGFDLQTLVQLLFNPYLLLSLAICGAAIFFWVLYSETPN